MAHGSRPARPGAADAAADAAQPSPRPARTRGGASGPKLVLVDAANVAHASAGETPRLQNILLVRDKLAEGGFQPILVTDASLRHHIDDREGYERLVESGTLKQAPAGTDADYFLLSFARELSAPIVSNDLFKDRREQFPEAARRVIRYMIVAGEVVLERRTRRRGK